MQTSSWIKLASFVICVGFPLFSMSFKATHNCTWWIFTNFFHMEFSAHFTMFTESKFVPFYIVSSNFWKRLLGFFKCSFKLSKICLIRCWIVKISSSKNQQRLPIHISYQAIMSIIFFIHNKHKSSKLPIARKGLIKIKIWIFTPKSSRSIISSKSCSSLICCWCCYYVQSHPTILHHPVTPFHN